MTHVQKKRPDEVRRPSPEAVWKIWEKVSGGQSTALADLARAVCCETGCSRATAYRAVADALVQGLLERAWPSQSSGGFLESGHQT